VFDHEGRQILTCSSEEALLWVVGQKEPIQRFQRFKQEEFRGAKFSRDEKRVLTWSGVAVFSD
jgi:hypothetical protein